MFCEIVRWVIAILAGDIVPVFRFGIPPIGASISSSTTSTSSTSTSTTTVLVVLVVVRVVVLLVLLLVGLVANTFTFSDPFTASQYSYRYLAPIVASIATIAIAIVATIIIICYYCNS